MAKCKKKAKRTTVEFTEEDLAALEVIMKRWGQQNLSAALRMCIHMVARAKEMSLEREPICQLVACLSSAVPVGAYLADWVG